MNVSDLNKHKDESFRNILKRIETNIEPYGTHGRKKNFKHFTSIICFQVLVFNFHVGRKSPYQN